MCPRLGTSALKKNAKQVKAQITHSAKKSVTEKKLQLTIFFRSQTLMDEQWQKIDVCQI